VTFQAASRAAIGKIRHLSIRRTSNHLDLWFYNYPARFARLVCTSHSSSRVPFFHQFDRNSLHDFVIFSSFLSRHQSISVSSFPHSFYTITIDVVFFSFRPRVPTLKLPFFPSNLGEPTWPDPVCTCHLRRYRHWNYQRILLLLTAKAHSAPFQSF
jgi:hypothetical protein